MKYLLVILSGSINAKINLLYSFNPNGRNSEGLELIESKKFLTSVCSTWYRQIVFMYSNQKSNLELLNVQYYSHDHMSSVVKSYFLK